MCDECNMEKSWGITDIRIYSPSLPTYSMINIASKMKAATFQFRATTMLV
jgi:hypothetical protein